MNLRIIYLIISCLIMIAMNVDACPDLPENGDKWDKDGKEGERCILRCKEGYSPVGCHVTRKERNGQWNHEDTICVSDIKILAIKAAITGGAGVFAALLAPSIISGIGFGALGVKAGSIAAWLQTPFTSSGSLFALLQKLGMTGITVGTQAKIAMEVARVVQDVIEYSDCEKE